MSNFKTQNCKICSGGCSSFMKYKMPIFMGAVEVDSEEKAPFEYDDMDFQECCSCGNVQIDLNVSPDILYKINHNIEVIGNVWKEHYCKLYSFIRNDVKNNNILEISDPSAKIAQQGDDYRTWTIIEPNPIFKETEKIKIISGFFDNGFKPNFAYDVLVHSHFMEHAHDPNGFLKKCFEVLPEEGLMIFSIPNMEYLLNMNSIPNNILHFEHTYFYDREIIEYLLNNNGFEIVEMQDYKTHSWFYKCRKSKDILMKKLTKRSNLAKKFLNLHDYHINKILDINETISRVNLDSCFIFSCHVNSQYYVQNGLSRVCKILDNSNSKQGKILYGTKYLIDAPSVISKVENPVVICSHSGPYFEEISKQLRDINPSVKIL